VIRNKARLARHGGAALQSQLIGRQEDLRPTQTKEGRPYLKTKYKRSGDKAQVVKCFA
jgi:hypothetical protein